MTKKELPIEPSESLSELSDEFVEKTVKETERIISEAAKDKTPNSLLKRG